MKTNFSINGFLKGFAILTALVVVFTFVQEGNAQNRPLGMFKNYFGTIDNASAGKGIRGTGILDPVTGESLATTRVSVAVPPKADIVAAFLYWETLEKTALPSSARGYLQDQGDSNPFDAGSTRVKILGKPLGATNAAPCWSSGGSTGSSNGAPTLRVYRADILRYLQTSMATGERVPDVTVMLQDSGSNGGTAPLTEGVSLVVVYRHPALPFKSVVIFDGTFTLNNSTSVFSQTIDGFYQASTSSDPAAKITYILGDGQPNFPENLKFNGNPLAANPFSGTAGYSWDDLTYPVTIPRGASSVTTGVDHGSGSFDCLSFGAILFSTTVQDTDADGLLDVWEEQAGFTNLATGTPMNLYAMGARKDYKDLFVEVDHMIETANDSQGTLHSHLPKKEALDMVGDAFKKSPVTNPNGQLGINVHFDVGNNYQTQPPDPYIVSGNQARGGGAINERSAATYCTTFLPGPPAQCVLPNQPGLVSWKKGLQHIKNNFFTEERSPFFHYVVFAHGLASKGEALQSGGFSARSISGRADLPGNSVVISLGRWRSSPPDTQVGSKNLQAATLLHELAHNLWGFHGGITNDGVVTINDAIVPRPNCNPNKQSVLNYLYQSGGLLDKDGKFRVDLSREALTAPTGAQDENALDEFVGLGAGPSMAYRLRWYTRLSAAAFNRLGLPASAITPAKAYCDGSARVENSGVIRVDGFGVLRTPIDWDYDGNMTGHPQLDINFNGTPTNKTVEDFRGFNDWKSIVDLHGLQQVGLGRNLFGLSVGVVAANLLQAGEDDLGEDDLGEDDLGEDDLGMQANLGEDDLGEDDLGEDDLGEDDLGQIAEIDEPTAIAIGNPPSGLVATARKQPRSIVLNWDAPAVGNVIKYTVYRALGNQPVGFTPSAVITGAPPAPTFTDTNTRNNDTYTYVVIAGFDDSTESSPSNAVTVTQ